jgi:hypothetical protein
MSTRRTLALALALLAVVAASPAPEASAASARPNFVLRCKYTHTLADDPIVFPGQPGVAHSHDFFGNPSTNAASTVGSMQAAASECRDRGDTAGYWAPTASLNGVQLTPLVMRIYYLPSPAGPVETIPAGLQMIGGHMHATSPAENPHVSWACGFTVALVTPRRDTPYDCSSFDSHPFVDGVIAIIEMPSCWDGIGLLPENVTYPEGGTCPAGFPQVLPRLSQRIHFGIMNPLNPDGSVALSLSSGPFYTMHSDFWNTWNQERLDQLVQNCLIAEVHCGDVRNPREISWTRQFGTSRYDHAFAIEADASGSYVAGFTKRSIEGLPHAGQADAFVRRYDPGGSALWTSQFGGPGVDQALALATDGTGVYVAGFTDGTLPGRRSNGGRDAFVARLGPDGTPIWTNQFGTAGDDEVFGIALDADGLVVAGSTDGVFTDEVGAGGVDTFLRRFTREGVRGWTVQLGTPGSDRPTGIVADGSGVYVAGITDGAFPGQENAGSSDVYLVKHDRHGAPLWSRQYGSPGTEQPPGSGPQALLSPSGLAVNGQGVFVVGTTDGTFPGQTNRGATDGFLLKYDPYGTRQWARQFGTPEADEAFGVDVYSARATVAGSTLGAFPAWANQGEYDLFVRRYRSSGKDEWTHQFGTPESERVFALSWAAGALHLAGWIHGAFPGETFHGDRDAFVVKLL